MREDRPKVAEAPSALSMAEASRDRAKFSGHGKALGAAGYRDPSVNDYAGSYSFLTQVSQSTCISPPPGGFEDFHVGVAWHNAPPHARADEGIIQKLFKGPVEKLVNKIDLDLGCLYELRDGTRGCIQAFGEKFGNFDKPPYILHSGDEKSGKTEGDDERLYINGAKWSEIKRMIIYVYIYKGAAHWEQVRPQIHVDVPGEKDLVVTLGSYDGALELCVIGELENTRGGIKLTNRSEYFPGHAEMDRAYGFGLQWADGKKE